MKKCLCGSKHKPGFSYYVSVMDGSKVQILLGPLETHDRALGMVDTVKQKAQALDPKAGFYAFGTIGQKDAIKPGILNRFFPMEVPA